MYTYDLIIVNDWGTGFTANLVITNVTNAPITWSTVEFDAPFEISQLWNGQVSGVSGDRVTVTSADWNRTIAPNGEVTLGFNGTKDANTVLQLSNFTLDGVDSSGIAATAPPEAAADSMVDPLTSNLMPAIEFTVTDDWGSGFVGEVTIANPGATPLDAWNLAFLADFEIQNIWGARFARAGNQLTFSPLSWNQTIAPGNRVSFGFVGTKTPTTTVIPTQYDFNGATLSSTPSPDPLPELSVDAVTITEAIDGIQAAFTVSLSAASDQAVTVDYQTRDGSAIATNDYAPLQGTLTFNPGETDKIVNVDILDDVQLEGDETFQLALSNPLQAVISVGEAIATIFDNDTVASDPTPTPDPDFVLSPDPNPDANANGGSFNYAEALQKSYLFYEAQRSGNLPDNNRIAWRGDSALNDGADVGIDLSGGYYDAGDHVKFGLPMAHTLTMLSWGVNEYREGYTAAGQLDEALAALRWGTDYLLKAHITDAQGTVAFWGQVGDGNLDHSYWGAPEDMTMARPAFKIDRQNPGSDLAAEAAAALAAAAIAFRPYDAAYAADLLANAEQLYAFADTYRGQYSDAIPNVQNFYNSWSGYQDELAWGAAWLYEATGDIAYQQQAIAAYGNLGPLNPGWTINWDDKSYGAAVLLAQQTGDAQYQQAVETWLNAWVDGTHGVDITAGGLRWISQWGSLRYAANTAFVAGVYADNVADPGEAYSTLAATTVDYLLGQNPRGASYVVGFGDDFPLQPHHRGTHGGSWDDFSGTAPNANILYGALVGGPSAPDDFAYEDSRSNYITNEVALDYNAGYTGAIARMVAEFGGDPLSDAELDALPGIDIPALP